MQFVHVEALVLRYRGSCLRVRHLGRKQTSYGLMYLFENFLLAVIMGWILVLMHRQLCPSSSSAGVIIPESIPGGQWSATMSIRFPAVSTGLFEAEAFEDYACQFQPNSDRLDEVS